MTLHRLLKQSVGGINYLVHPQVLGTVTTNLSAEEIRPVVLLDDNLVRQGVGKITTQLGQFEIFDDVYTKAFSDALIVNGIADGVETSDMPYSTLTDIFKSVFCTIPSCGRPLLPAGPYFVHGNNIHQAWRLYPDVLDAFIYGVIPRDVLEPDVFDTLALMEDDGIWKSIAVPSRLYADPSPDRPLAGTRTCLKDIFRLKGVKTTMMSRAFLSLYGPEEDSADYVKKLLNLGAVILGKTKMTQFASSDEPTDQWIDFHCPFNPRGDMYQSPLGSSSGAAAALAGYDWIDYSIAGDSAGSVRAPATCNGLFSLRPSLNSTSMRGVFVNSPRYDVVGLFTRNLEDLYHLADYSFDLVNNFNQFPTKIIYPVDFFPYTNEKHQKMVDEFVSIFERFLGTKRTEFSIADRWAQRPPEQAGGKSLEDYLQNSAFWSLCRDYYLEFSDYRSKYQDRLHKDAYEGPVAHYRWGIGKDVTDVEYSAYLEGLHVFRDWFDKNVFCTNHSSLSDAVMIMPYGSAEPKYRDSPNRAPFSSETIGEKFMSPILHMPQLVLPFGQMPYQSRVSGRLEHLPIASSIMGAKGSDLMLIKLAKAAFESASWPTTIDTGRYMYSLADNVRNVANFVATDSQSDGALARNKMRSPP